MADEKKFHVGVKAVIENEHGKLLLMKEDVRNHSLPTSEYWDFPGGRMQKAPDSQIPQRIYRSVVGG